MTKYYFAEDGSYGEAEGLVIVDTGQWTEAMWKAVSEECESDRLATLLQLDDVEVLGKEAFDWQGLTESEAETVRSGIAKKFGWQGYPFNSDDLATAWEAHQEYLDQQDYEGKIVTMIRDITEADIEALMSSSDWNHWLPEVMCSEGMQIVEALVTNYINNLAEKVLP